MNAPKISRRTRLEDLPELLRVDETAAWCGVSRTVIYGEISRGHLAVVRLGRLIRIARLNLKQFVERGRHEVCGASCAVVPVGTDTATEPIGPSERPQP